MATCLCWCNDATITTSWTTYAWSPEPCGRIVPRLVGLAWLGDALRSALTERLEHAAAQVREAVPELRLPRPRWLLPPARCA